jgi:hypothetical protein
MRITRRKQKIPSTTNDGCGEAESPPNWSKNQLLDSPGTLTLAAAYRILRFRASVPPVALSLGSIYADSSNRENLAQRKVDQLG